MYSALEKLHLSPSVALFILILIVIGSFVDIPIRWQNARRYLFFHPLRIQHWDAQFNSAKKGNFVETTALNVGGCVIPIGLAFYEAFEIALYRPSIIIVCAIGAVFNILVCYLVARPVQGVGIVIPSFISPFFAASFALLFVPESSPPVAHIIGVVGPLVGADLLHLSEVDHRDANLVSIGGAGTFDAIVLSGLVAAYLA